MLAARGEGEWGRLRVMKRGQVGVVVVGGPLAGSKSRKTGERKHAKTNNKHRKKSQ